MQRFEELFSATIQANHPPARRLAPGECQSPSRTRCRVCYASALDYDAEIRQKDEALGKLRGRLGLPLDPIVRSPLGRGYRTTTKRRAFSLRDSVRLGLLSPDEEGEKRPFNVVRCAIEPDAHNALYAQIEGSILKPYARRLAKALGHVVIKGNYSEQTVILNVDAISPELVHAANTLSKSLTKRFPGVVGVFLYEDDSSPGYYLGSKNPAERPRFKKLFGKAEIFQRVLGRNFLYSPFSFSQINLSILDEMIGRARSLLLPTKESRLYDLYCGYGLFGLCLSDQGSPVVGAEIAPASIASAIANARRQKARDARFIQSDITGESVLRIMARAAPGDLVVLDPPRKGTQEGVIEAIAAKQPRRVLHLFCEIDLVASELKRWEKSGYRPRRAIPFDMFPGTATIETMVLLERTDATARGRR